MGLLSALSKKNTNFEINLEDVVYRRLLIPRKQFLISLSTLGLTFQIIAIYSFNDDIKTAIYSKHSVVVFCSGEGASSGNELIFPLSESGHLS